MIDMELKRKRIETVAKVVGVGVVGFFVAPFVFIAIKGLIGLVVAAIVGFTAIQFIPVVALKIANRRLKSLKFEAGKNPIETLQNAYNTRQGNLAEFRENIVKFKTEVLGFSGMLEGFKEQYPKEAPKFQTQYENMVLLLKFRHQAYKKAMGELELFDAEITKAKAIWEMAQAANAMTRAGGSTEDFLRKIQVETALESVTTSMNSAFADLELSLDEKFAVPVLPAGMTQQLPESTGATPASALDLDIDDVKELALTR